jgi:hypothetical protein
MASGRDNKLVGAAGEYRVAAELCRRGLVATTFTGNVPHYDIVASDERGRHASVQVKTIRGGGWQFSDVSKFFEVKFDGQNQITGKSKRSPVKLLVVVFVMLGKQGVDKFYMVPWERVRDIMRKGHENYIAKHGGKRPKKWDSLHGSLVESQIVEFKDRWDIIENSLR